MNEVRHGLPAELAFGANADVLLGFDRKGEASFLGGGHVEFRHVLDEASEIERLDAVLQRPGLKARDQEQRVERFDQLVRFLDRALQTFPVRFRAARFRLGSASAV